MEVNHRNNACRDKARDLLMSETGVAMRGQRCIEPEAVFGDIRHKPGFKRFRLGQGEDRVRISDIGAQLNRIWHYNSFKMRKPAVAPQQASQN